jgi:twinkle protein
MTDERETFAEHGIRVNLNGPPQQKTTCPGCSNDRKKREEPCLSVNVADGVWNCFNCGWSGVLKTKQPPREWRRVVPTSAPIDATAKFYDWLARERGIPRDVAERNGLYPTNRRFAGREEPSRAIAFPYVVDGGIVNVKYRCVTEKLFAQEKDAERALFKADDLKGQTEAIICEGEYDALAFEVAGYLNAVSMPDGAPNANDRSVEKRLVALDTCGHLFRGMATIYLATDADENGIRLREELARRLGKERCRIVEFPMRADGTAPCKDANETLIEYGPEMLEECITKARRYPIEGIITVADLAPRLVELYAHGFDRGSSVGLAELDPLYRWVPPAVVMVTGVPSAGKSTVFDWLMVNHMVRSDWRIAWFTPENFPLEVHTIRLTEQLVGMPFLPGYHGRMPQLAAARAFDFLNEHAVYVQPRDDRFTLDEILERFSYAVRERGVQVVVIDPWNTVEQEQRGHETLTQYTARVLNRIRFWTRDHNTLTIIVAHPKKMGHKKDSEHIMEPDLYDISDSAHWRNIADAGFVVHRVWNDTFTDCYTRLRVAKVKHKHQGSEGVVRLDYESSCQRFFPYTPLRTRPLFEPLIDIGSARDEVVEYHVRAMRVAPSSITDRVRQFSEAGGLDLEALPPKNNGETTTE